MVVTEDMLLKLFDKSPLLVMCILIYLGFVLPAKKATKAETTQAPQQQVPLVLPAPIVQYDDSNMVRSMERLAERQEENRVEMKEDLRQVKTEILDRVSHLETVTSQLLLQRKGHA